MPSAIHAAAVRAATPATQYRSARAESVIPRCQVGAFPPKWGATVTDQSQVTCKRCCKLLGIQPAVVVAANPSGTCQCCFGHYKVVRGITSLHGYERPGNGYIVGACNGQQALPYQQSCELTKVMLQSVKNFEAARSARLAALESGAVTEFIHSIETRGERKNFGLRAASTFRHVAITLGDDTRYEADGVIIPSFERKLENNIWDTKRELEMARRDIYFLTEKVEAWVLAPLLP
jgi:hypothetical protein